MAIKFVQIFCLFVFGASKNVPVKKIKPKIIGTMIPSGDLFHKEVSTMIGVALSNIVELICGK